MRRIKKSNPPKELIKFILHDNPKCWKDLIFSKNYPNLHEDCLNQLWEEQHGLCGYTELPLHRNRNLHIDHFRKQSLFKSPNDIFNWDNLIGAMHFLFFGADSKDAKGKELDYSKLINPTEDEPHDFFTYMNNGSIIARRGLSKQDKERAEYTIEVFNLNHQSLIDKRKNAIMYASNYMKCNMNVGDIVASMSNIGLVSVLEYTCNTYSE